MRTIKFALALALVIVTTVMFVSPPVASAHAGHDRDALADLRAATARYHNLGVAKAHGYALLTDAAGIACIANPPLGAMGVHYVNGTLVGSGQIHALTPQALVYEPEAHGKLHLVAVEYVTFQASWDATHQGPPKLFGQTFMLTTAPNRYGLPAFYSLHVWIWKHNPSGMFSMWNPHVDCDADAAKPATA